MKTIKHIIFGFLALSLLVKCDRVKQELKPPNILFIIADDASMNSFGAYGCDWINTPAVDKLAREGVVFTNAYNCNPKCAPARACLLTGMYSWQLKEACNHFPHFPNGFAFYPDILMEAGYHVGLTGKGWGPGTYDRDYNPAGPSYDSIKLDAPYTGIRNVDYAANFEAFLDQNIDGKPFCFWLGTYEPHRPYEKDSWKKVGKNPDESKLPDFYPDNKIIREDLQDYAIEVEWYDLHVGRAVKALEDRGLLENTLILVTSDHGMPFPRIKGQIYEEGFHVPLVAYWEGVIQPGRTITDFVSFPDVAPTILEAVDLQIHSQMTGKSFFDILKSKESGRIDKKRGYVLLGKERHDVGRANQDGIDLAYPVRAIRNDTFLYVHNLKPERWPVGNPEYGFRNCDNSPTKTYLTCLKPEDHDYPYFELCFGMRPEEELYNIVNDPDCITNLAEEDKYKQIKNQLRKLMESELLKQGDPRMLGTGDVFDKYPYMGKKLDYTKPNSD